MNTEVAKEVFELHYSAGMELEKFNQLLTHGLELLRNNPNTDRIFVNRFYKDNDLRAVNIAMVYNEHLLVKMLMENH